MRHTLRGAGRRWVQFCREPREDSVAETRRRRRRDRSERWYSCITVYRVLPPPRIAKHALTPAYLRGCAKCTSCAKRFAQLALGMKAAVVRELKSGGVDRAARGRRAGCWYPVPNGQPPEVPRDERDRAAGQRCRAGAVLRLGRLAEALAHDSAGAGGWSAAGVTPSCCGQFGRGFRGCQG